MQKIATIFGALLLVTQLAYPQNDWESVLAAIRQNNPALAAAQHYREAQLRRNQTALSLENPEVSADYLIGVPKSGGNQKDLQVFQRFDFPTVYARRGQLVDRQAALIELEIAQQTQQIMWSAQQTALKVIHLNKQKISLRQQFADAQKVLKDYEIRFQASEISSLEVNKARIRHLGLQQELRRLRTAIASEMSHLIAMNGGKTVRLSDTTYPSSLVLPALQAAQQAAAGNDLELRRQRQQVRIDEKQIEVSRALTLPKIETGYHYQSVLGQVYNGVHLGTTIPLWENRKQVKADEAMLTFRSQKMEIRRLEIEHEIQLNHAQALSLQQSLAEYQQALSGLNTREILQRSLELGEINFIEYAMELDYYYAAYATLLDIEFDYYASIAALLKYNL